MFRRAPPGVVAVCCLGMLPSFAAAHFAQPPCAPDEVKGEIQDASGFVCAPHCEAGTYNCPADVPSGATAQPQCMLKDVDQGAFCGLLCQVDSQCPSGARCKALKQQEVGMCLYPISFADWASQGTTRKLAIGWPSAAAAGGSSKASATSFQIAKTYQSLQSLKSKYAIDDGDADMLTLKEFLSSLSASGEGGGPAASPSMSLPSLPSAGQSVDGSVLKPWEHDLSYFEGNIARGLPGLQRELQDTLWNIEHMEKRGVATELLRGVILFTLLYLVVGSIIKHQSMGSRGIDMVPHIGFWSDYPSLVADGVLYSKILAGMEQPTGGAFNGAGAGDPPIGGSRSLGGGGLGGFEAMA